MPEVVAFIRARLPLAGRSQRGATAVEYGVLVALIALAIVVAVGLLGSNIASVFNKTSSSLSR